MKKELKIFILSLFIIPVIPFFILYKKGFVNYGYIVLTIFWLTGFLCFLNKNFANHLKIFTDKLFSFLGKYIAIVILFLGYIFVVLPTAFIMKMTKRDRLRLSKQNFSSYWVDVQNNQTDYERQF